VPPQQQSLDSTPGPESLASVLEPTPGPQRTAVPAARAARPRSAGRSFLIGMAIGAVILGVAVAAVVAKRSPSTGGQPPAQTQPH
jgi:hypothetical protein